MLIDKHVAILLHNIDTFIMFYIFASQVSDSPTLIYPKGKFEYTNRTLG